MTPRRRYPFVGSPSFWYRVNRWTLAHAAIYALIGAVGLSLVALPVLPSPLDALVLAPVLYLFTWWNFTRGPGRRITVQRIHIYESDSASRG